MVAMASGRELAARLGGGSGISPPPDVCEDKFGYIGLLHLHYLLTGDDCTDNCAQRTNLQH